MDSERAECIYYCEDGRTISAGPWAIPLDSCTHARPKWISPSLRFITSQGRGSQVA
jgi:hypothetical protein